MEESFEDYRMSHLVRTADVWKRLCELGADESTKLDFDFSFITSKKECVDKLKTSLSDYKLNVSKEGVFKPLYTITGSSGLITWNEEQLLKWTDYLITIGQETECRFDGCGASLPND